VSLTINTQKHMCLAFRTWLKLVNDHLAVVFSHIYHLETKEKKNASKMEQFQEGHHSIGARALITNVTDSSWSSKEFYI